jgi:hypothetical protein
LVVTAQVLVSYSLDLELQHRRGNKIAGLVVTAQVLVSYSTLDGELQHT